MKYCLICEAQFNKPEGKICNDCAQSLYRLMWYHKCTVSDAFDILLAKKKNRSNSEKGCFYRYSQNILGLCSGEPKYKDRFGNVYCEVHAGLTRKLIEEDDNA